MRHQTIKRDTVKTISLKSKTFFLSGLIITLLMVVGYVGIYAVKDLSQSIHEISQKSLPAVRNMTLVDMMHDGMRAVVYRSMVATQDEHEEVKEEFKEFSTNITKYLSEIEKLGLDEDLNNQIKDAEEVIKKYSSEGQKVINFALANDLNSARSSLPNFIKSFDQLAEKLELIGSNIQKRSHETSVVSQKNSDFFLKLSSYIMIFGVVVACFISFAAYSMISGLTSGLLDITKDLRDETDTIIEASDSLTQLSTDLSEAATEQASSVQQTVASLNEISAMVSRNSDSSISSASKSDETKNMALTGRERARVMKDSIHAIAVGNEEILQQIQKSNGEISEIVRVIQNISQKTEVINDIVFQTKLLSFNASVEAARAGESGKGFAVVAQEVGNLASMSGKAATEITEMLAVSVKQVTGIVERTNSLMQNLIRQSKEKVDFGTVTSKQCSEALEDILGNVTSVNEMVSEIAAASKEQTTGVNEINHAMQVIDQVTQKNTRMANESSRSAVTLQGQATRLNQLVVQLNSIVGGKSTETPHSQTPMSSPSSHRKAS
jgi:methyl-accepting chemotaxis protein